VKSAKSVVETSAVRTLDLDFGLLLWEIAHMTTLVTADDKGRIPVRGTSPGRKYLVIQSGDEWRVTPFSGASPRSRNRREWAGVKGKATLFDRLKEMADAGLRIERSESSKQLVPPCRF
jgi:hypothetical protein